MVWLARDSVTGKSVVMKTARAKNDQKVDLMNAEKLRFEMDVLRLLKHRNIVRVEDELILEGSPVLVLEFIGGEVLEKETAGRPLSEERVLNVTKQLLEATDYIHSLNLIHRDIAPKNVFASEPLKLFDFGTAKFFYSQAGRPEAVVSPGGYTAPEQYRFASSPQGDLWAVGATVFYACTGQPPILALGNYPQSPVPADPARFNRRVTEMIRQLVIRATQADPTKRFATAREMLASLGQQKTVERPKTRLVIKNEDVPLEGNSVILGRMEKYEKTGQGGTNTSSEHGPLVATQDKCEIRQEGDSYLVKIPDPLCYISRRHAELFSAQGGWYVRDLGSLNKTAVYSGDKWVELWRGHSQQSDPFRLSGGEWISLAYDSRLGPYMTALFRID